MLIVDKIKLKTIKKSVTDLWTLFLDLIFPIECVSCGKEGEWLCSVCRQDIHFSTKQDCPFCHREHKFGATCSACKKTHFLDGLLVAVSYNEEISTLIKYLKYYFVRSVGDILGGVMSDFFDQYLLNLGMKRDFTISDGLPNRWPRVFRFLPDTIFVSVPLHKRRLRWRGFNQSELFADILCKNFGLKYDNNLVRIKYTKPQAGTSKKRREKNLSASCFRWQGEDIIGKRIILIDDVSATSTTLDACAEALKNAGASQVWGMVLARG